MASATAILDGLEAQHRQLDDLLGRWSAISKALAEPSTPFRQAQGTAVEFARELRDFIEVHLAVEDADVLPLFWRHYTAAEYEAVQDLAVKKGRKAGMWFVAPFSVDCYASGPERDAFLASVPGVLRLFHRVVRPHYDRLLATAFGSVDAPQVVDTPA